MVKTKSYITEGPIFFKLLLFALPIMATGVLQLLYNMADTIVVGQFSGDPNAIGAVGATATLNGLIVNFMVGLAGGATVVVAQFFGARKERMVSRTAILWYDNKEKCVGIKEKIREFHTASGRVFLIKIKQEISGGKLWLP